MEDLYTLCHSLSEKYADKTIAELFDMLDVGDNISVFSKIAIRAAIEAMLDDNLSTIAMTAKKRILLRIIGTTKNGKKKFDNKLFLIDFKNLLNPAITFQDSQFYNFFNNNIFLYALYEFPDKKVYNQGDCVFLGFKVIGFGQNFIAAQVQKTWDTIRDLIFNNKLVDVISKDKYGDPVINCFGTVRSAPNFPKSSDGVVFVRGGGSDSTTKPIEINGIQMYQQFIWLRGDYVLKRLLKERFL